MMCTKMNCEPISKQETMENQCVKEPLSDWQSLQMPKVAHIPCPVCTSQLCEIWTWTSVFCLKALLDCDYGWEWVAGMTGH